MSTPLHNETSTPTAPPVAPGRMPLVGHLGPLLLRPLSFVQDLRAHGDIVQIYLGPEPVYVINSAELVHRILVTQASDFEQGRMFKKGKALLGDSLITRDGPGHQRLRRLMQPAFQRERIARYAQTMTAVVAATTTSWRSNQPLDVAEEMLALTMDIVIQALFNANAAGFDSPEIQRLLTTIFKGLTLRTLLPTDVLEHLPTPGNRRFEAANARFHQIVNAIIRAYRADGADRGDLLSMLLLARDPESGEGMTDQQVLDVFTELTIGGHKTTGTTLAWFFHELGRNPDVEERVHQEVDAVLGGRPASYDDLPALEYMRRVLNETLRRHHPFWLLMKRTIRPVTLQGVHLPADTEIISSSYALHRDPVVYRDPLVFDPERWLPERVRERPRTAFMPFGAGKRVCIGESFALTAMTLAVAAITRQWQLLHVPGQVVHERPHLAVHPDGLWMTAIPRNA